MYFCLLHEKVVSPHPLSQFGHGGRDLPYALADRSVKAQVHGDGGAEVGELIHLLQGVVVNLYGGSMPQILGTDQVGLFDADGKE